MNKPSDKSEDQKPQQPLSDFAIERVGFALFSGIAGLIYAGVICVTLYFLKIELPSKPLLHSFMVVFGCVGAILGPKATPIIMSTVYGLMYLWGVILGFIGYELPLLLDRDNFPKKSEYLWCAMLGFFAVAVFLFIK